MAAVKRGRWWKGPLVAVASAVVMLLTIEAGHRVWLAAAGTPYDAEATAQEIEGVAALLQGELPVPEDAPPASSPIAGEKDIVHPYFGIDFSARVKELTTDAAYFAGPESAENLDVVLLGGSVAAIFGDLGAAPLRFVLEGDPRLRGKRLRISNQGRGGFKQPQQALVLAFVLGLGWKPDVVVNLDGFNEVALTMENASYEVFPGYPVATEWGPVVFKDADNAALTALRAAAERRRAESGRFAASVKAWRLERCSILGTFALARLRRWAFERAADTQRYLRITFEGKRTVERQGPAFDASDEAVSEVAVKLWSECSRSIAAMCKARGIPYVHALQPTLLDAGSKRLTADEARYGAGPATYVKGVSRGYPRLRQEGERLKSEGVAFLDLSMAFQSIAEPVYVDVCHYNFLGNRVLAEAIGGAILEALTPAGK
jgi:hypothetical protein